jgi:hypothetical protein
MNSSRPSTLQRWRRRLAARLARPQPLWLDGAAAAGFADWCQAHAGQAIELIVSARLSHELVCEPGLPLGEDEALAAYARQLFGHYFGAAAQRWAIAGWSDGTASPPQHGASALHGADWAALRAAAEAHDVELRQARPAWSLLLQRLIAEEPDWARQPRAALAWIEGQVLTWLQLRAGQVIALRQLRLAEATPAALAGSLSELRGDGESVLVIAYGLEGEGMPMLPGVRVLGRLDAAAPPLAWFAVPAEPAASLPRPDFLGPRITRSRLAWPLALTGALVLATAAWSLADSRAALAAAGEQHSRLAALLARTPRSAKPAPVSRFDTAAEQDRLQNQARLRAAAEVQALLQQPWEPLLARVEQAGLTPPAGGLAWLGLDYSAGRNELRLEGLVQDKLVALQLVDQLAATPGWQNVVLGRFQNADAGLAGQRFELSARLQPARLNPATPMAAVAGKDKS